MEFTFEMNLSLVKIFNLDYINNGIFSIKFKFISDLEFVNFKITYINKLTNEDNTDKNVFLEVINNYEFNIRNIKLMELETEINLNRLVIVEITILIKNEIICNNKIQIFLSLYNNSKLNLNSLNGSFQKVEYDENSKYIAEEVEFINNNLLLQNTYKCFNIIILNSLNSDIIKKINKLFCILFNNKAIISINGFTHIFLKNIKVINCKILEIQYKSNNDLFKILLFNMKINYDNFVKLALILKNNIFIKYKKNLFKKIDSVNLEFHKYNEDLNLNSFGFNNEVGLLDFETLYEIELLSIFEIEILFSKVYLHFIKLLKMNSFFIFLFYKIKKEEKICTKLKNYNLFNEKKIDFLNIINPIFNKNKIIKILNIDLNNLDYKEYYIKKIIKPLKNKGLHLVVLVHGLNGNFYDLSILRSYLLYYFPYLVILNSNSNENKTYNNLDVLGKNLSKEINNFIENNCIDNWISKISFIGYSLGGLIIRSSLRFLKNLKNKFFSFITLASPHAGIISNNKIWFNTGLLIFKMIKNSESLIEITLKDENEFLLKLSKDDNFFNFKNYNFIGSIQDDYCSLNTSILNLFKNPQNKEKLIFNKICFSLSEIQSRDNVNIIKKTILNFNFKNINLDTICGRTAHIQYLEDKNLINLILIKNKEFFL